jgi:hypothetical protein
MQKTAQRSCFDRLSMTIEMEKKRHGELVEPRRLMCFLLSRIKRNGKNMKLSSFIHPAAEIILKARRPRTPRSRQKLLIRLALAGMSAALAACAPPAGEPGYVFAANFYGRPVSLLVGEEPRPVFASDNLAPAEVSRLHSIRQTGDFIVQHKPEGREQWQRLPGEIEDALCRIRPGEVTALVVDRRGFIRSVELGDDLRPGARLCLLNASSAALAEASLTAPGAFPVFRAENLKSNAATRIASVVPGDYRLAAVFAPLPAAPGGGPGLPDRAPLDLALTIDESTYWLVFACVEDNAIVLRRKLLAIRQGDRLVPPAE